MAFLKNPFFGAKSFIPYARASYIPYGVFEVVQEVSLERSADKVKLTGGNAPGAYAAEYGQPENAITATLKEYPHFAFELLEGITAVSSTSAEASRNVGAITNKNGATVMHATTGIASVAVKEAKKANLPLGRVVLTCLTATTVSVKVLGQPFGDVSSFETVGAQVEATVTITGTDATVDVDDIGITITGGSGTVGMTVGHTASFDCRPVNTDGYYSVEVGNETFTGADFGAFVVWPKQSDGSILYADLYKLSAFGINWKAVSREYSEFSLEAEMLVDTCNSNKLYKIVKISPTSC